MKTKALRLHGAMDIRLDDIELPEMTEDEVKALIAEIKAATGASSPKDMGKIMKELSPKVKGRFDAKRASALVQEALK